MRHSSIEYCMTAQEGIVKSAHKSFVALGACRGAMADFSEQKSAAVPKQRAGFHEVI